MPPEFWFRAGVRSAASFQIRIIIIYIIINIQWLDVLTKHFKIQDMHMTNWNNLVATLILNIFMCTLLDFPIIMKFSREWTGWLFKKPAKRMFFDQLGLLLLAFKQEPQTIFNRNFSRAMNNNAAELSILCWIMSIWNIKISPKGAAQLNSVFLKVKLR